MSLEDDNHTYDSIGELYDISIEEQRALWHLYYINKYIYVPSICPKCNNGTLSLINNESVLNPIKGSCNNKSCKTKNFLRKYSIFSKFNKMPIQILMNILKAMLVLKKMVHKLENILKINITV